MPKRWHSFTRDMTRDKVFKNANIITLEDEFPGADCMVVRDGTIISFNAAAASSNAEVIDCAGKTIVPGFVDTHIHLYAFSKRVLGHDLSTLEDHSIEKINGFIADIAAGKAPGEWITIFGYDPYNIAEKRLLTRWDIDASSPDNPVRMYHRSGQGQLCNSKALEMMGIDDETEDPDGGMIDREVPSGEPTGMLYGMDDYISLFVPEEGPGFMEKAAKAAGEQLAANGITCVHDATLRNDFCRVGTLEGWSERKLLPQRVVSAIGIRAFMQERESIEEQLAAHPCVRSVKLILNEIRGRMNISSEELAKDFTELSKAGVSGCIHCVDEEQQEASIEAIEAAEKACPFSNVQHRIEHASLCTDEMADRMAQHGIGVSSQPAFLYYSGERYLDTIDSERIKNLYRFGTFARKGITVAFSSDAPISPAIPLKGIYSAVTRKTLKGRIVCEEEAVSAEDALRMYTINGAKLLGLDDRLGSLSAGKQADFAVLDRDPLAVDPEEIKNIKVEMTVIGGEIIWKR